MKRAGALTILVRLDLANGRAFLRGAGRDPVFVIAAVLAVIGAVYGFRRLLSAPFSEDMRQLAVILAFAYLVATFYVWNSQGHLARLTAGPFQHLVASPRPQAAWLALRSAAFAAAPLSLATIAALTLDPASALALAAGGLAGMAVGAAAVAAVGSVLSMASSGRAHRRVADSAGPEKMVLRPTSLMLTWAHLRRKIGPAPAYVLAAVLLILAGAAGALAKQNSGPAAGAAVLLAFSLAAAWLLVDIDLTVVRQLGHEAISLVRLGSMFAGPALVVMIGVLAAAFAAGLGPAFSLLIAAMLVLAALAYVLVLVLNGLVLSPPAARLAAAADISLAVILPLMAGVWGEFWIIARIFMLILAARRLRWRDL